MKKWGYLLSGILIGAVVATSGSAAAAQIKSLVGQKVTAELTVVVNGTELPNKAPVINGVTNAPVRAITDALGANLALEGKVISITTESVNSTEVEPNTSTSSPTNEGSKYSRMTKEHLEAEKINLENRIENLNSGKQQLLDSIERVKQKNSSITDEGAIKIGENNIKELEKEIETFIDPRIKDCLSELEQVNEALEALNK